MSLAGCMASASSPGSPYGQKAGADRFDAFSSRSLIFSGSGVSTLGAGSTLRRYRQRLRGKIRRRGR